MDMDVDAALVVPKISSVRYSFIQSSWDTRKYQTPTITKRFRTMGSILLVCGGVQRRACVVRASHLLRALE